MLYSSFSLLGFITVFITFAISITLTTIRSSKKSPPLLTGIALVILPVGPKPASRETGFWLAIVDGSRQHYSGFQRRIRSLAARTSSNRRMGSL